MKMFIRNLLKNAECIRTIVQAAKFEIRMDTEICETCLYRHTECGLTLLLQYTKPADVYHFKFITRIMFTNYACLEFSQSSFLLVAVAVVEISN